jgi:hypothetical protein
VPRPNGAVAALTTLAQSEALTMALAIEPCRDLGALLEAVRALLPDDSEWVITITIQAAEGTYCRLRTLRRGS